MIANAHRGEIEAILNDKAYRLRLTLGGLADLESYFQVEDLHALLTRFGEGRIAAQDLLKVLSIGLKCAGNPIPDDELRSVSCEGGLTGLAHIVGTLFAATFADNHG